MKKAEIFLVAAVLLVASLLRLPLTAQGFFAFTYDQGRDLLAAKEIILDHNLTLIGPTTGLMGIFYGPWWYYFLASLFVISKDPVVITFIFGIIGVVTVFLIYLLIKKITGNIFISIVSATVASTAQVFLTTASQIWSPSLVPPLIVVFIFSLYKIFQKSERKWFYIMGLSSALIFDTEAAFGIMLIASTIIASFIFNKQFFNKKYVGYFLAMIIILSPRIVFELRHEFLMTNALFSHLGSNGQNNEIFTEKLMSRLGQLQLVFAQTFSQSNKLLVLIPQIFAVSAIVLEWTKIKKNNLFRFLLLITPLTFLGFVIYPGPIWDYYLIGLPTLILTIFAMSAKYLYLRHPAVAVIFLLFILIINFDKKLLAPFSLNWQGDGAIYKNQKAVIEYLKSELKGDYSLHFYSPARFDYPFDYIIWMYHQNSQIDLPKENQKRLYLVIRDDQSHSYLPTGWYGDKVRDNTTLLDKRHYTGDIIVEKHQVND